MSSIATTSSLPDDRLWTVDDVCRYLQMGKSWVHENAAAGVLPSIQMGRARRFDPVAVKAYAQSLARGPQLRVSNVRPLVTRSR